MRTDGDRYDEANSRCSQFCICTYKWKSGRGLVKVLPCICPAGLNKTKKNSVKAASDSGEFRTEHLPNSNPRRCRCTKLLVKRRRHFTADSTNNLSWELRSTFTTFKNVSTESCRYLSAFILPFIYLFTV